MEIHRRSGTSVSKPALARPQMRLLSGGDTAFITGDHRGATAEPRAVSGIADNAYRVVGATATGPARHARRRSARGQERNCEK